MTTFTRDRFEDYCSRFGPAFRAELITAATFTDDAVSIPAEHLAEMARRYRPHPRPHPKHPATPPPEKPRGLGDLVATLAEPIARFSDAHLGTHLVGCQSCAERRAALNRLLPGK